MRPDTSSRHAMAGINQSMLVLCVVALAVSATLTGVVRRYALKRQLVDVPGARSSHQLPTPRGGGVAIVLVFLGALPWLTLHEGWALTHSIAIGGGGALVAMVGFLDDHAHVAARWRLAAHFLAAFWVLAWLDVGEVSALLSAGMPEFVGFALAAVGLVWMLNLYNFMDGIDAIAGGEAVCVCLGGAALTILCAEPAIAVALLTLVAAVGGFLVWNLPPAKIFMGDVGSGFLGLTLGSFALMAGLADRALFWAWLILLGVFVVDATWTLMRRLLRGDRVYEAHRSHAYQRASRLLGAHLPVTLAVVGINLLWLLPCAWLVATGAVEPWLGVLVSYTPLVALVIFLGAGTLE